MRVNRSTLARLCLLTALAVPIQRPAFATVAQGRPEGDINQLLIAQDTDATASEILATSPDGDLIATTDDSGLVSIEDAEGNVVAGPLSETGGTVTALAFSDDAQTFATGSESGQVRYWSIEGEPQGELFPAVVGEDSAVTALRFEDDQTLFVEGTQGRQGLWGLDGVPPGESIETADADEVDDAIATETAEANTEPLSWWVWLIPLLGIVGLGWLFLGKRDQTTTTEAQRQTSPTATVPPPPTDPKTDREVSSRAQTIISTDRVTDESRVIEANASSEVDVATPAGTDLADANLASADVESEAPPLQESTDLESSPDLAGTNLDLATASMATDDLFLGESLGESATSESDRSDRNAAIDLETDDPWDDDLDDNLQLTLDDEPNEAPSIATPSATPLAATDEATTDEQIETEKLPTGLAESVLASSLEQEPSQPPAVEMPAIETPITETAPTKTTPTESSAEVLEAPAIQSPPAGMEARGIPAVEAPPAAIESEESVTEVSVTEASTTVAPVTGAPTMEPSFAAMTAAEVPAAEDSTTEVFTAEVLATKAPVQTSDIDSIEPTRDTVIAETETILDIEPTRETIIGDRAVIFSGAAVASVAAMKTQSSTAVITALAASASNGETRPLTTEELASTDDNLADLPEGYGESRIVLLPRDPEWAYAYWDVSNEHKEQLRQQGGQRLMLRIYDVTDLDLTSQVPHSMQQVDCHEMARSWYLEMPVSDRDYIAEIGYLTDSDQWLLLARSAPIRVPPIYPSDWVKDQFVTIDWQERLVGRTFGDLGEPYSPSNPETAGSKGSEATDLPKIYDNLFALTQSQEALRVAGSLYGSMQQGAPGALSPSGGPVGLERFARLNMSGLNMSGLNMSGIGSGGSELAGRSRKFWLVADAELIVYGATEPDATLTVGDKVVPLNPDGTFRFHVSFPDGQIDYPIRAVAADGEQTRSIRLNFERETPERSTNTKDEAEDEWF